MTLKTYTGGCHCGAVKYTANIDLSEGTTRCNCSVCNKARAWFTFVREGDFTLKCGAESLADYQWTPPGKPHPHLHYQFCATCGIRTFARGDAAAFGGVFYAVSVATLDNLDPLEIAASIKYVDGLHDHYDRPPADIRLL
jgi:hypothetical protein